MILEVVQSKWSLTWYDPLGPRMCVLELMNGHVLRTLRKQLKVLGFRLEGSELLTSEFLRFRSRLNETSGGLGKIGAVSGSDRRILKFLRTTFLAAKYHFDCTTCNIIYCITCTLCNSSTSENQAVN